MTSAHGVPAGMSAHVSSQTGSVKNPAPVRMLGWAILAVMAAFLLNNYLNYWQDLPGIAPIFGGKANSAMSAVWSWGQLGLYGLMVVLACVYVSKTGSVTLRQDSRRISDLNAYLIRAAFWAVLIVGVVDTVISFLRVEGLLEAVVGTDMTAELGRSQFRGAYVHMPLIALSFVIAAFTRTLGFTWLALLVVVSELLIVIGRFIFSYEQAFMADLVRFWYAGLFLFASAYTLLEEGHVRVDILYASLSRRTKGYVNAIGSLFLGVALCWVVLIIGMGSKQSIINSPILSYETTQAGFGLYVKYLMAGYLGVFAVTMMVQFVSYFMDAVADIRGEPGGRDHDSHAVQ
ncbi:TRAP transporter small permease subunit [Roseibium suaedae]|uniref:TRAP transporter small permease protein n=1 Tax=Roseibium suaedae TaxID=735517 RepID=A0A1M7IZW7_9HYPH|nr:TRAP transporter small permease subunit [Roseibium suaedae]SHM46296.1 Tripartite ATP-independent transporter, DctQ component [Roseibium suaedae]